MDKRILGALLVLTGLTFVNISAKSNSGLDFKFVNKTGQSLIVDNSSEKIKTQKTFCPEMKHGNFMKFKICTKDGKHCLTIRPSENDSNTVVCCNNKTAHSLFKRFIIFMEDGDLCIKGTGMPF